jgi:hypothetical protein
VALFWTAMAILEVGEQAVFSSALAVLETTLRTLDQHDAFRGRGIGPVVMAARHTVAELCDQLDSSSGISFTTNFSFAVVGVLLKGLNHNSAPTIARTLRVLTAFLNVERSARGVELHPEMLGYISVLFPLQEDLRLSLANEQSPYGQLLTPEMLRTDQEVALVLTAVCSRLEHTKHQTEMRHIYEFLAHACERYSRVFPVVHSKLSSKVEAVIQRPQDAAVILSCHSILRTLVPKALLPDQASMPEGSLQAVGFGGLISSGSFERSKSEQQLLPKTCSRLLARLLALVDSANADVLSVCSPDAGTATVQVVPRLAVVPPPAPLVQSPSTEERDDPYGSDGDVDGDGDGGELDPYVNAADFLQPKPAPPERHTSITIRSSADDDEEFEA